MSQKAAATKTPDSATNLPSSCGFLLAQLYSNQPSASTYFDLMPWLRNRQGRRNRRRKRELRVQYEADSLFYSVCAEMCVTGPCERERFLGRS